MRASFEQYAQGQRAAPRAEPLRRGPEHGAGPSPRVGASPGSSSPGARRERLPRRQPDLHRRHAALGLDAPRADPGQPLCGRGHDGIARDHHDGAGAAGPRRGRRYRLLCRRPLPPWAPEALAELGRELPRAHTCASQDGRACTSSTRCRTTSCTSAMIHARAAECEDHRRPPASAGLLFLQLQAALRPRPELQLRPRPTWAAITATTSTSWPTSTRCCRAASTA